MQKCQCKEPRPAFREHIFMKAKTGSYSKYPMNYAFKAVCKQCGRFIGWYKEVR